MSASLLAGSLLAGALPAAAHSPHDTATTLSVAPDGALLTNDGEILAISTDAGASFAWRESPVPAPDCVLAASVDTWVVADAEDGAWWTDDGGLSWTEVSGPVAPRACARAGDALFLGGEGGAWRSDDGGLSWEMVGEPQPWTAASLDAAAADPAVLLAVDTAGEGWRYRDGAWSRLDLTGLTGTLRVLRALDDDGTRLLAAQSEGPLAVLDPPDEPWHRVRSGPRDVRTLGVAADDRDRWIAAQDQQAAWITADGGTSWVRVDEGLDPVALHNGAPNEIHYWAFDRVPDGDAIRWAMASYEGLYRLVEDGDDRWWAQGELDGLPRVRTVDWLPDGTLLAGSYGGGLYRGTPLDEGSWDFTGGTMGSSFPKTVEVSVDPDDAGAVHDIWVSAGPALHRSTDGGLTWPQVETPWTGALDAILLAPDYPADPRAWVGMRDDAGRAAVAWTEDGGETWEGVTLSGSCTSKPRAMGWNGTTAWLTCGGSGDLWRSDDGRTWEAAGSLGVAVLAMASGEPLLLATASGILALDGDVEDASPYALDGMEVDDLERGPDGRLWVAVTGHGVGVVGDDGAVDWLGWPVGDHAQEIAVASDGTLAVATRSGAWVSLDDGATWALATTFDRVNDDLQQWRWEDWTQRDDIADAAGGRAHAGGPGAVATLTVEAVQVRLVLGGDAGTRARITLDGEDAGEIVLDDDTPLGELWAADVEAGRHTVTIEVLEGNLLCDGAKRWRSDAPPLHDDGDTGGDTGSGGGDTAGDGGDTAGDGDTATDGAPAPGDGGDTGCGCGGGGGALLLLPLAALRRRRPAPRRLRHR